MRGGLARVATFPESGIPPARSGDGRYSGPPANALPAVYGRTDLLRIALFLVICLSIGRMHQHYSFLAPLRPALVLFGLAIVMAILSPKSLNQVGLLRSWQARIVCAIGLMALISAPLGISLGASAVFIISDFSKTLVLSILVIAATRHTRDLATFAWAFVLGCAFLVYLSLFHFQLSITFDGFSRLSNLYMYDANDINSIIGIGLGLVALFAQAYTGVRRYAAIVLLLGMGAAVARSGSRGGFLGLVTVGACLLLALNHVAIVKRAAFVGAIGLGLALFAPPGYWDQMKTILSPKEDYNWTDEDGRKQIWERGMGYMITYPVAGLGINNFARAECTISDKALAHVTGTGLRCAAPHNTYLQAGAELGIPGMILWLVMVFGSILKMRSLAKRQPRHWEHGDLEARFLFHAPKYLMICMCAFAVTSVFVSHAYLDPVYLLLALMAGTYTATAGRMRREGWQPAGGPPAAQRERGRLARAG
jgi:O-antigen ligase